MSLDFMGLWERPLDKEVQEICDSPNYRVFVEKLRHMGFSNEQANSNVVKQTFALCASNPEILELSNREVSELCNIEERIERARSKLYELNERNYNNECCAGDILQETKSYIDEFNSALEQCETAEGRDTMRLAQMFVNTVNIESAENNTAYINGLACILSNGKCGSLFGGFKKIDEKKVDDEYERWKL